MNLSLSLSIIFICHNNVHIDICLNSVIEQLNEKDEIIVVDDYSDSYTQEVLEKYVAKKIITLIHSDKIANRSYNRNLGVRNSHNEILLFLDGDMVLGNRSLNALRLAHEYREENAFIGQKHTINFDECQLKLYAAIPNYLELLETEVGREQLEKHPLLKDAHKRDYFMDVDSEKFYWTHYYTGLCSVERKVFDMAGGFDEHFNSWGSEDVDLGYRISKFSKIGFITDLHGFHIPHLRNVLENETSNLKNIAYMLKKYGSWEFEILLNLYGYGHLKNIEQIIQQMRMLGLSDVHPQITEKDIIVDSISSHYPNGNIKYFINKKFHIMSFLGVAIPCESFAYKNAYVSDHIFIYPQLLTCRILQEALRIAEHVYIYETSDSIRLEWGSNTLPPRAQKQHCHYEANDLLAFTFFPTKFHYIEVKLIC